MQPTIKPDDATTADPQIRPFAAVLRELAGGKVHSRLSEQLHDLTAAVTLTGKKGTLTVQLVVEPLKGGQTDTLTVTAKSVLKAPEPADAAPSSVFFADRHGNLTRDNPIQPTLPLRGLDGTKERTA